MTAMTGRAGRSAQVAALDHCLVMHAIGVVRELSRHDAVRLHESRVGMATLARLGHVQGMYGRARIGSGTNVMYAVAVGTDRDVRVSLSKLYSVHAGLILSQLIRAQ